MNPTALQRLGRVEEARHDLGEAHRRLDAALLAQGPSPDNIIITAPLLALLRDAVAARRHLRGIEGVARVDGSASPADEQPAPAGPSH